MNINNTILAFHYKINANPLQNNYDLKKQLKNFLIFNENVTFTWYVRHLNLMLPRETIAQELQCILNLCDNFDADKIYKDKLKYCTNHQMNKKHKNHFIFAIQM